MRLKTIQYANFVATVEPRYKEVLAMKNDILQPGQSYSKMRKIEPRYNEPRYNEIPDITNAIQKPKRKIYRTTNKCHHATKADPKLNA